MAFATDPFTQVYNGIWALLESNSTGGGTLFQQYVKAANRIKFDKLDPIRDQVSTKDAPEVGIFASGGEEKREGHTTTSRMLTQRYTISISTGEARMSKALNPIKWAVVKAVLGANGSITTTDSGFSISIRIAETWAERFNEEDDRMPKGWLNEIVVETWLTFSLTALQATDS